MLAFRYALGFLVQIVPCAILCAWPFADRFRGMRKQAYAAVAGFIAIWDVVFTFAAAAPLSYVAPEISSSIQNGLFFIALAVLLGIFIYTVDADAAQKLFVFFVVMCFGYTSVQTSEIIVTLLDIQAVDSMRMYDPASLAALIASTLTFFIPTAFVIKGIRGLLTMPLSHRAWLTMDLVLFGMMTLLMVFEMVPKFFEPLNEPDIFLSIALALGSMLLMASNVFIAHTASMEARRRMEMANAIMRHKYQASRSTEELSRAHIRIAELEQEIASAQTGNASVHLDEPEALASDANEEPVVITSGSKVISFLASNILYADSLKRIRTVHFVGGEDVVINLALAQLISMLPADKFIYCHRSVIVNLDYVEALEGESIRLADGTQVPVGRRRMAEVRRSIANRST